MSDGGAQVIVEGVKVLWQVPGGKVVLAVIAGYLGLSYLTAHAGTSVLIFLGVLLAAVASIVAVTLWNRRKRKARARLQQALVLAGLGLVAVVVAGVAMARRSKGEPVLAPPTPLDVDAAARELS